ncbi:MAG: hypothetical protein R6V47_05770 [Candidatus Delongbacteria bacterium]
MLNIKAAVSSEEYTKENIRGIIIVRDRMMRIIPCILKIDFQFMNTA